MKIRIKTSGPDLRGSVIGRTLRWLYVRVDNRSVAFETNTGSGRGCDWHITPTTLAKALEFTKKMGAAQPESHKKRSQPKPELSPTDIENIVVAISKDDRLAMVAKAARKFRRSA